MIDAILKPWQRFGVHLGLERMHQLLAELGNPHRGIPVIHVAGSNGKGSVCAYLTSMLATAGYRVGGYTSPHLIRWQERITIDRVPISEADLVKVLQQVQGAISPEVTDSPTQFEVFTAAAWLYFAQQQVDIAVIEVGLGGRLDATNVVDTPLVSVITSLSLEHTQQLGDTLGKIAFEKAGIIKAHCPVAIGQVPPEAKAVFLEKITSLASPPTWVEPAQNLPNSWAEYQGIKYPLALLGEFQLMNSALAIATIQILQSQGWQIDLEAIQTGMANTQWQGRVQWQSFQGKKLLIDGAHNPAAAIELRHYVDGVTTKPIHWVMGILSTKDHKNIFQALLRPHDHLYLVPVPDHSSADPHQLADLAQTVCPDLTTLEVYPDINPALQTALAKALELDQLTVLCGSLYLVGDFLRKVSGG
jgi:dihydrofolate synthase/folylpolyglutamate synthase